MDKEMLGRAMVPGLVLMWIFSLTYCIIFKNNLDDLDTLTEAGYVCVSENVNVNEKWHILFNWGWIMFLITTIVYSIGILAGLLGKPAIALMATAFTAASPAASWLSLSPWVSGDSTAGDLLALKFSSVKVMLSRTSSSPSAASSAASASATPLFNKVKASSSET
eukprot:CAMPEP_0176377280 /NCGR_PEP_ID=MMETSP0126-20121128/28775_1 /TAXON_ID=141414 ORGANISM="Strombidinopsis acuminatum, Strain SPMC142" /NCGR_SAMPLE_ID=MMETSP0126 /ASSEMBLY_ACC=CAM_ASM_000229 /LENGTH=164 /DNA_ID=CAMNT_0017739049 /DNA_START=25 /DNA_END=520 /DNA_ORIENTATION=-